MCDECISFGGSRALLVEAYNTIFAEDDPDSTNGHIVFADYNVRDSHIDFCLGLELSDKMRAFLTFLKAVPWDGREDRF